MISDVEYHEAFQTWSRMLPQVNFKSAPQLCDLVYAQWSYAANDQPPSISTPALRQLLFSGKVLPWHATLLRALSPAVPTLRMQWSATSLINKVTCPSRYGSSTDLVVPSVM